MKKQITRNITQAEAKTSYFLPKGATSVSPDSFEFKQADDNGNVRPLFVGVTDVDNVQGDSSLTITKSTDGVVNVKVSDTITQKITALENKQDKYITGVTPSRNGNTITLTYAFSDNTNKTVSFTDNDTVTLAYDDSDVRNKIQENKTNLTTLQNTVNGYKVATVDPAIDAKLNPVIQRVTALENNQNRSIGTWS